MNRRRLLVVMAGFLIGAFVVFGRSVQIAVVEHGNWMEEAHAQQQRVLSVQVPRGTIYSADGYVLATSIERVAIQVNTRNLEYPEIFVDAVAPLLGLSKKELERRLSGEGHSGNSPVDSA